MTDRHNDTHKPTESPGRDQQQEILLVDDDNSNLIYMSEILRMSGYVVASFHDAPSALLAIREGIRFDLVITDYRMLGMNGLEFIEALRRLLPVVPVIMLTAHGDIDTYFKALNLGVFEYVHKPLKKSEILRITKVALDKGMQVGVPSVRGLGQPILVDKEQ